MQNRVRIHMGNLPGLLRRREIFSEPRQESCPHDGNIRIDMAKFSDSARRTTVSLAGNGTNAIDRPNLHEIAAFQRLSFARKTIA
jgi:hypothetical protein